MRASPTPAQAEASRLNGAQSAGPASQAGKARSAVNGARHGLTGRTFFLLPDEDPAEFAAHEARWLAEWRPDGLAEQDAAECAVRALWREIRADRLEARILGDLFAAEAFAEEAERRAAKALAMRALGTLLRYRAQIAREYSAAMHDLDLLRRRRLAAGQTVQRAELMPVPANDAPVQDEPERLLNRHERRALAATQRKRVA
jgi:hypothetical protein